MAPSLSARVIEGGKTPESSALVRMFCDPVWGHVGGVEDLFLLIRPDSETVPCYENSTCGVVEVMLLSGRCCSQVFDLDEDTLEDVLRETADLLGLDEDQVLGSATLMHGTSVIADLQNDLEAGKLHELTLVMS